MVTSHSYLMALPPSRPHPCSQNACAGRFPFRTTLPRNCRERGPTQCGDHANFFERIDRRCRPGTIQRKMKRPPVKRGVYLSRDSQKRLIQATMEDDTTEAYQRRRRPLAQQQKQQKPTLSPSPQLHTLDSTQSNQDIFGPPPAAPPRLWPSRRWV